MFIFSGGRGGGFEGLSKVQFNKLSNLNRRYKVEIKFKFNEH